MSEPLDCPVVGSWDEDIPTWEEWLEAVERSRVMAERLRDPKAQIRLGCVLEGTPS